MDSEKHRSALYENRVCGVRIARENPLEMLFEKFCVSSRCAANHGAADQRATCWRLFQS